MMLDARPMLEEYSKIKFNRSREKFKASHSDGFRNFYLAKSKVEKLLGKDFRASEHALRDLKLQLARLNGERNGLYAELSPIRDEVRALNEIRRKVDRVLAEREKPSVERAEVRKKDGPER